MKPEQFEHALDEQGIKLKEKQMQQFADYFQTLVTWNDTINLTTLTRKEDVYLKHFYDSISAAFYHDFSAYVTVCDVGAGAGFPSIPLKICFPHLKITIVDSLRKRIKFLHQLTEQLGLEGIAFYHDRAENLGQNRSFRESFDIVMSRAVARMSVLSELCLPLTKLNGLFLAMKGAQAHDEINNAKTAVIRLGGDLYNIHTFDLPAESSERAIIAIHKNRHTPGKYPRNPGLPNKRPIV